MSNFLLVNPLMRRRLEEPSSSSLDNAAKPHLNQVATKNTEHSDDSKEKVKLHIEQIFEAMIESLSRSDELIMKLSSRTCQNVGMLRLNYDKQLFKEQ